LAESDLVDFYQWMSLLRLFDSRMMNLQRQGRIGFYGVSTGEEAAVVGSAYALTDDDWIFPALRQGGAALMRGMPLTTYIAQIYGNSLDVQKGRQMPVHYCYEPVNFVSWGSCIGTQLPHAVGMAWAAQVKRDPVVAMAYLGDGATSEGDFHVAMNFAGVKKSPVVFFCQNNQWAISVPLSGQTASENSACKAEAYGFEGVQVDGNDVIGVYQATKEAVDKARNGGGPTLIEAVTYRLGGHSSSDDPSRYRDESEVEIWKNRCPIERLRAYLESQGMWDEENENKLMADLNDEISSAVEKVEAAPAPELKSLFEDIYDEPTSNLIEQSEYLERIKNSA